MKSCPNCKKSFRTKRGLETHIGRVHDPLPKERLVKLYIHENLSAREIADKISMSHQAVKTRLTKYNLWGKDPCRYQLEDDQGYASISQTGVEDVKRIRVHRLIAIYKGYDPYDVFSGYYDVDHINNCKLDNRPNNIQLLDKQSHGAKHAHDGPKN